MFQSFTLRDDLATQDTGAIEVELHMRDGSRRGCYFMTPTALAACGDWIDRTQVRIHYGAPHMIVVAGRLTEDIIEQALQHIARAGEIEKCSLLIE
jgi:hypothetical protein